MDFPKLLGLRPGVTAVIGSGGKTSLLRRLAEELPGTVLLCTTTHIRPFEEYPLLTAPTPEDIRKALTAHRVLCLGTPCENGKLTAPSLSIETLATLADYVLGHFSKEEQATMDDAVKEAADAVCEIVNVGIAQAMNDHNRKKEEK